MPGAALTRINRRQRIEIDEILNTLATIEGDDFALTAIHFANKARQLDGKWSVVQHLHDETKDILIATVLPIMTSMNTPSMSIPLRRKWRN